MALGHCFMAAAGLVGTAIVFTELIPAGSRKHKIAVIVGLWICWGFRTFGSSDRRLLKPWQIYRPVQTHHRSAAAPSSKPAPPEPVQLAPRLTPAAGLGLTVSLVHPESPAIVIENHSTRSQEISYGNWSSLYERCGVRFTTHAEHRLRKTPQQECRSSDVFTRNLFWFADG